MRAQLSTWSAARWRLAALAVVVAVATVATGPVLVGSPTDLQNVYLAVVVLAVFFPAAIAVQVICGQLYVLALMVGPAGLAPLLLVPTVAGVVATAELLAVVARLGTPLRPDPGDALARTGSAAILGGAVFAGIVFVSALPGPTGFVAVALASAACALLAARLAGAGHSLDTELGWSNAAVAASLRQLAGSEAQEDGR